MDINDLIRKAGVGIGTEDFLAASGLLAPEQSKQFNDYIYDTDEFSQQHRHVIRRSRSGTIAKMGIASRVLRPKHAGVDDATPTKPGFGDVGYQTVNVRLDTEIENEVLEENIEEAAFEDHWLRLNTDQIGRDLVDLHFNGDPDDTGADAPFLNMDQGWLYQLANDGLAHRLDGSAINAGAIEKDHFQGALELMPDKYKRSGRLRWLMNDTNVGRYVDYLTERVTAAGDAALIDGEVKKIRAIPPMVVNQMPNDRILLTDPMNLISVSTKEVRQGMTKEGKEALRRDVRFYVWFLDTDAIIEEQDAVVDIHGLNA